MEHSTCTGGGCVIALEDDIPRLADVYGIKNPLEKELRLLRKLSDAIREADTDLHLKLAALAVEHNIEIPTERVVNTGGGGQKGP